MAHKVSVLLIDWQRGKMHIVHVQCGTALAIQKCLRPIYAMYTPTTT